MTPRGPSHDGAVGSRAPRPGRHGGTQAAFTLVELTVALVAGLIVALGIVGLSREATRTFHEEMRSSAAEATLRTAVDRLRGDLKRAAYMSCANIAGADPHIAHTPGETNTQGVHGIMLGVLRLAGVHLFAGGSLPNTQALSQQQSPPLSPDAIEIGGNMTSADQFEIQTITDTGNNCKRLTLSANSPALYRVMAIGPTSQAAELNNMFQPDGISQFIVRLVDDTGRAQYLATCGEQPTAGFAAGVAFVDVDSIDTPLKTAQTTQTLGGVSAMPSGRAWVNPVQIVRWEIVNAALEPAPYLTSLDNSQPLQPGVTDPNKYDLVRSFVDATGTALRPTMEVIAEYAVDLNFAFSVEQGSATFPSMLTYSFDDPADNQLWADDVSIVQTTKPQRIRVVRARIVTRTAQPDRTVNIPVVNVASGNGTQAFLYRYCITAPCATNDGTLRWARTRTITTEVSLPNQEGDFF